MELHEMVIEMKLLERRLTLYEEKYGILSADFHTALVTGKFSQYEDYDETRTDFSRWKVSTRRGSGASRPTRSSSSSGTSRKPFVFSPPINAPQSTELCRRLQSFHRRDRDSHND